MFALGLALSHKGIWHTQVVGNAVQQAVAAAIEDGSLGGSPWDWHANVYTLVAITGVVLFWRGLWTLWCLL